MPLRLAVWLLSSGAIALEILLMRLLSIIQWHHFAYMVISLALLGYGASGTLLTLLGRRLDGRVGPFFVANACLFGPLSVVSFAAAQRIPFNPLEAVWNPRQLYYLALLYLVLTPPFLCVANCIGVALARFRADVHAIYRADLLGAGVGAAAVVAALFAFPPTRCLQALAAIGLLAAAVAAADRRILRDRRPALVLAALALVAPAIWPAGWLELRISEYKGLSKALRLPGATVVAERSSPLGLLTAVDSPQIPFRYAPGLSLNHAGEPPPQIAIFSDGEGMTVVDRAARRETLSYLDYLPSALPYHLLRRPRVAVLGAGGGTEVASGLWHGAAEIIAVEYNPGMVDLVRDRFQSFSGGLYRQPAVRVRVAEARGFLHQSRQSFDLLQISLLDSFAASAAGVHSLSESYLYTVEAFDTYLDHLAPGGLLTITRWLRLPPRDSLKLIATAAVALQERGVDPRQRVAAIRSWNTVTLLIKNGAFTRSELQALRAFCDERSFDTAYYPGMKPSQANRYNLLDAPYLFDGARALLGQRREEFLERYKFQIRPATDDRPYFFHFLKWRVIPELLQLRGQGGKPLIEWGYVVLLATLAQAALAGLFLILLPLRPLLRRAGGPGLGRVGLYFLSLGLGFLFVEIAFIQRFTLFLGHPLYAVALVLASFLVFAGLGSGFSRRFAARPALGLPRIDTLSSIATAALAIVGLSVAYLLLLPPLFDRFIGHSDPVKVLVSLALIAPLAFFMGMPFPLGLQRVGEVRPEWIPWAWGVNGWASVLSAVLATLTAIHLGFRIVVLIAAALYAVAAVALRRLGPSASETGAVAAGRR